MNTSLLLFDLMMVAKTFAEADELDWAQEELSGKWEPRQEQQSKAQTTVSRKIGSTPVIH